MKGDPPEWSHAILSPEEQLSLVRLARQGDGAARHRLVLSFQQLVVFVAREFLRPDRPLHDLVQMGQIGLLAAVDGYDPTRGVLLVTYATHAIRKRIQREVGEVEHIIRLPPHILETLRIRRGIMISTGADPDEAGDYTLPALVDGTRVSAGVLVQGLHASRLRRLPLDDFDAPEPDAERPFRDTHLAWLEWALRRLTVRQATAVRLYYGLDDGGQDRTLQEVGRLLGVSYQAAQDLHRKAIGNLRKLAEREEAVA